MANAEIGQKALDEMYNFIMAGISAGTAALDGKGAVSFEGRILTGGKWNKEKGVYEGDSGEYTYTGGYLTFKDSSGKTLHINQFFNKDLGITLDNKKDPLPPRPDNGGDDNGTGGNFSSPLVLDLNRDGVTSTFIYDTNTHFDMEGDGYRERTGWTQSGDGLLVLDRNQNNSIDNGNELFGNYTRLANGTLVKDGFAALAQYDENGLGRVA